MKIKVIIGSTRPERFSDKPGKWIFELLKDADGVEPELLDLRDYPMPFYDEAKTPKSIAGEYSNEHVRAWVKKINEADGYVIITPEYNHGYPAVLKNALDYPFFEWNKKAVGFISYGSANGARAIEQLRQIAVELRMAPIGSSVQIPFDVIIRSKQEPTIELNRLFGSYKALADEFIEDLKWWVGALRNARNDNTKAVK